jgi:hypothetical protein
VLGGKRMLKKDLLKMIENISDESSVDEILTQSDFAKSLVNSGLTLDAFKEKLQSDKSFIGFMDSARESHFTKALETWKTNNLDKLVQTKVKELYPEQDPKDLEVANLKKMIEDMQKDQIKKDLTNKAFKVANEKKLPVELIDFVVGNDEETTMKNIETLSSIFAKHDEEIKTGLLKEHSYVPPVGGELGKANPWAKDSFNLTKQGQIMRENPILAAQLKEAANK